MASYEATVRWRRGADETFTDNRYSRAHEWAFDGGAPGISLPTTIRRSA
jgi:hypothetical protein